MKALPSSIFTRSLCALLVGFVGALFCSNIVAAAPNTSPDQDYFTPYGNEQWLVTAFANPADSNFIDAPVSQVKLYTTSRNFQVTIINPGVCRGSGALDQPFSANGSPVGSYTNFKVYPLSADEVTPDRATPLAAVTALSQNSGDVAGSSCGGPAVFNVNLPASYPPSNIPGHNGMFVSYFEAVFGGTIRGYNNRFKLVLSDPNAIIAYSDGAAAGPNAYKFAMLPDRRPVEFWGRPTYWSTYTLPFAPSCSVASPQTVALRWFDDDYGQFNQSRAITMQLQKINASTGAVVSTQNLGTPQAGPNNPGSVNVTIEPGFKYQWVWSNVQYNNGLQFQLPYDSIYFYKPCPAPTASMRPVVAKDTPDVVDDGQVVTFTHNIYNDGPGAGTTNYTTTKETAGGAVQNGSAGPIAPGAVPHQVTQYTYIARIADGTKCDSLRIQPSKTDVPGSSLTSKTCVTIGKSPLVHFKGGDVWAGGGFATDPASAACTNAAKITTFSRTLPDGTSAGSGVEYAAFALGKITKFGSAATALTNPSSMTGKLLTFSNTPDPFDATKLGYFGASSHCIDDYYARFSQATSTSPIGADVDVGNQNSGVWIVDGPIQLHGTLKKGVSQVYVVKNGAVSITGDLKYPDSYAGPDEIPSLVVISYVPGAPSGSQGNIEVRSNVQRMDGIFVAKNTFSTCDLPPVGATNAMCRDRLTVNGAVLTRQLKLNRTAGAEGNTPALLKTPAEVFNLTPEVYLRNALNNSSKTTITTTDLRELPPRF